MEPTYAPTHLRTQAISLVDPGTPEAIDLHLFGSGGLDLDLDLMPGLLGELGHLFSSSATQNWPNVTLNVQIDTSGGEEGGVSGGGDGGGRDGGGGGGRGGYNFSLNFDYFT